MNENEPLTSRAQQLAQYMHRYMTALEQGDSNTLLLLLLEAEHDPALERMIMEVNAMYQSVDGLLVAPHEVQDAHQFLRSLLFSAQSTDMVLLTTTTKDKQGRIKLNGKLDTVPLPSSARQIAQERIDSAMEAISSPEVPSSSLPSGNRHSHKHPTTPARLHRLSRFVQMLAAVLVVSALIGGFAFIAVSHLKTQDDSSDTGKLNRTWRLVPNPNPGATDNQLQSVVALSADDAWAVGNYDNQSGATSYTLIEHWNGKQWQVVQSPNSGSVFNDLNAVTAIGPDDVWAVGTFSNSNSNLDGGALVEHWNGKQWSIVPDAPGPANVVLQSITALAANDIWAVGSKNSIAIPITTSSKPGSRSHLFTAHPDTATATFIEHWNGTTWTVVPSPNLDEPANTLMGVKALSANDVWAAGFAEGTTTDSSGHIQPVQRTLTEHWDGTKWSIVPSPNASGQQSIFYGMTAIATNDVWAVGVTLNYSTGISTTLVEHWNGTLWSVMSSPNAGAGNVLMQVNAIAPNNVWAVGYYSRTKQDQQKGVSRTLIEHWDGTNWSVIASPNPDTPTINLWSVAGVPGSNQVWAVGIHGDIQGAGNTLSFSELFS